MWSTSVFFSWRQCLTCNDSNGSDKFLKLTPKKGGSWWCYEFSLNGGRTKSSIPCRIFIQDKHALSNPIIWPGNRKSQSWQLSVRDYAIMYIHIYIYITIYIYCISMSTYDFSQWTLGFSQFWSSFLCTQSARSCQRSEPGAWPKMGQHLRSAWKWNIYGTTSPENERFDRISPVNIRSVCHPKNIEECYVRKPVWFSAMWGIFSDWETTCNGWAKAEDPRVLWCTLLPQTNPRPRMRRQKCRLFENEWHSTTQVWLQLWLKVICPSASVDEKKLRPLGEFFECIDWWRFPSWSWKRSRSLAYPELRTPSSGCLQLHFLSRHKANKYSMATIISDTCGVTCENWSLSGYHVICRIPHIRFNNI